MRLQALSVPGYFFVPSDDGQLGSVVFRDDMRGDALLPGQAGSYRILEQAVDLAAAEATAQEWWEAGQ